jgi:AraC-like DNA-binding protein
MSPACLGLIEIAAATVADMPGYFTKIEVADPHGLGRLVWDGLPPRDKALVHERLFISSREWAPLDRRRFRIEPESYRTEYSVANVGALRIGRIADSHAMQMTIRPPLMDGLSIVVYERGSARLVLAGTDEPAIGNAAAGCIYSDEPGTWATTSDGTSRRYLWLPAKLLRRKLEALLDGKQVETIAFQPMFDQTHGAGATIRRMFDFMFAELEHSDTLLTNEIATRSFEDNLALCILLGLPHNYSEKLGRQKAAAAPGNVRRAETFMRANAGMPVTIAEIAEAAGCGVRALQIAFHRFRGITPMRVLQQARLEQARTEMLRPGQSESLARIAAAYGFSSPTRFAQSFRRKYGIYPSEMLRERRLTLPDS